MSVDQFVMLRVVCAGDAAADAGKFEVRGLRMLEGWDGRTAGGAIARLLHERDIRGLGNRWSIAQLCMSDADFASLRGWLGRARATDLVALLNRTDRMELPNPAAEFNPTMEGAVGLLLAAICSEAVRRDGSTYAVWPCVSRLFEQMPDRDMLLTNVGPRPVLKRALRTAAQEFSLLGFEVDDAINYWFRLLLLQAGIPNGDTPRLAAWLDTPAQGSFLVDALKRADPGFANAWASLLDYRRGRTSRDAARRQVGRTPLLRAPADAVLDAVLAQRDAPGEELEADDGRLDLEVRVTWTEQRPRCQLLVRLGDDSAFGRLVTLKVNGTFLERLRRDQAQRFPNRPLNVQFADEWRIEAQGYGEDPALREAHASLFSSDDEAVATVDVQGCICKTNDRNAHLLVTREMVQEGPGVARATVCNGFTVLEIDRTCQVTSVGGAVLWSAEQVHRPNPIGAVLNEVLAGEPIGAVTLRVQIPAGLFLRGARIGLASLAVGTPGTLRGVVLPEDAQPELALTLNLQEGENSFSRTERFRAFTSASIGGAWLTSRDTVEAAQLRSGSLRLALGPEYDGCDPLLDAGGVRTPIGGHRVFRVAALGYGEALVVHAQAPWSEGHSQVLIGAVTDHGELVEHQVEQGAIAVTLRTPVEPGELGWLLVWPRDGAPRAVAPLETPTGLRIDWREEAPRAVAWCFGTRCLGASWAEDWSTNLEAAHVAEDSLVDLIRTLFLPVLAREHRANVEPFLARTNRGRVLDALAKRSASLVVDERRLESKPRGSGEDGWACVARTLALKLRIDDGEHRAALSEAALARFPQPIAAQLARGDDRAQLVEWFKHYLFVLEQSGALHPRDALEQTPARDRPQSIAARMAFEYRGISVPTGPALTPAGRRRRGRLKDDVTAQIRGQVGPLYSEDVERVCVLAARANDLVDARCSSALIDPNFHRLIQLSLIDAFAQGI